MKLPLPRHNGLKLNGGKSGQRNIASPSVAITGTSLERACGEEESSPRLLGKEAGHHFMWRMIWMLCRIYLFSEVGIRRRIPAEEFLLAEGIDVCAARRC